MTLNDFQKIDMVKGIEKISCLMTSTDSDFLDLKGIENRIQQTLGVIYFLNTLQLNDKSYKNAMIETLRKLYQRKKALLYGYEDFEEVKSQIAVCG